MEADNNRGLRLIQGGPRQMELDFMSDADLEEVIAWQDIQWKANLETARKIEAIENRLKRGAVVTATRYYFDPKRRLVRSRKSSAAAGE